MYELAEKFDATFTSADVFKASTCINLLLIMLPYLLTIPQISYFILWTNDKPPVCTEVELAKHYEDLVSKGIYGKEKKEETILPFGAKLAQSLLNLLFMQNFTICKLEEDEKNKIDPYGIDIKLIWTGGLQHEQTRQQKYNNYNKNRLDLLRLILLCLSSQLYSAVNACINFFPLYFTCGKSQQIKNFFFSLLNVSLSYNWKGYVIVFLLIKL